MCERRLGPQLTFSVYEGDRPHNVYGGHHGEPVLTEAVSTFHNYYGSGEHIVEFIAIALATSIRRLQLPTTCARSIRAALSVADKAYRDSCCALQLQFVAQVDLSESNKDAALRSADQTVGTTAHDSSDAAGAGSADQDDDTDWFFSDEQVADPQPLLIPQKYLELLNTEITPSESAETVDYVIDDVDSVRWLLQGLQHSLPHEFASLGRPSNPTTGSISDASDALVALPMQLAGVVARHLWLAQLQSCCSSGAKLQDECSLKPALQRYLHTRVIRGLPSYKSCALPGRLVMGCSARNWDSARACNQRRGGNPGRTASKALFHRVVVAQANLGMLGAHFNEENALLGNSQQARAASVQQVITGERYLQSLRTGSRHSASSYVSRICAVLQRLRVDLVIGEEALMTDALIDGLTQADIALLPVGSVQELHGAASLARAGVVEDLIGIEDADLGTEPVSVEFLLELPAYCDKYSTPSRGAGDVDSGAMRTEGSLEVGGTAAAARRANGVLETGSNNQNAQCLVSLSRGTIRQSEAPTDCEMGDNLDAEATPVSVLICAATQALAAAYEDRFQRCLHRLRGVLEAGCAIMPGAGLPEVLCMTHIDEQLLNHANAGLLHGDEYEDQRWVEVEVLKAFRDVLSEYVLRIGVNNGISHATMQQCIHQCSRHYRMLVTTAAAGDPAPTPTTILDAVRRLSTQQKQTLPAPVNLAGVYDVTELQHVLDPVRCKVAAVHAALLVVKQTL